MVTGPGPEYPFRMLLALVLLSLLSAPGGPAAVVPGMISQVQRGEDQRHVAERLRGVADLPAVPGVVLLAQQADIAAQRKQPLEKLHGLVVAAGHVQRVHQPEAAGQEGT